MANRGTSPDDNSILPELSSLVRASEAREKGDEFSAKFHEMMARENARRERLRLRFPTNNEE